MKIVSTMRPELYCYFVKMAVFNLTRKVITARELNIVGRVDYSEELDELHDLMMDSRLTDSSLYVHLDYVMGKLRNWKVADMTALGRVLSIVGDVDIEAERSF